MSQTALPGDPGISPRGVRKAIFEILTGIRAKGGADPGGTAGTPAPGQEQ